MNFIEFAPCSKCIRSTHTHKKLKMGYKYKDLFVLITSNFNTEKPVEWLNDDA